MLTRDQLLTSPVLPAEKVQVPELGGEVTVRTMSGTERDAFEAFIRARSQIGKLGENYRAALIVFTVVDESGALMFTEADIDPLGKQSWLALDRIVKVAARLNSMADDDLKEAEKN
jgi:hypothetical protein